jgi:signal transduction histidine kinase
MMQESLISNGKKIIQTYRSTSSADLIPFMQSVASISNNAVQIYNSSGQPLLKEVNPPIRVVRSNVDHVLKGGIERNLESGDHLPLIGLPFQSQGKSYALFMRPETNSFFAEIAKAMRTVLIFVLLAGSVLILVASRYIVEPVLRLTEATRLMAHGNFDVAIRTQRKDEIGQLTTSFNEMAQELANLDRMRQQFVANVSHEIQTPLTSISGFTKALKQKRMTEDSRLHYLTIIEEESERLSRLSQNLLRLSALQEGHHPVKIGTFRLDEQIRKVVIALEPQWAGKQIDIDLRLDVITVEADEDQLSQVWTNLLSNSIKFSPSHSSILVECKLLDDLAIVSIKDQGLGIPDEERIDIFKPFHKVDKARDRSITGNGLGLSIVKQIVDIHRGKIQVSGGAGEGSIFTVRIPLHYGKIE